MLPPPGCRRAEVNWALPGGQGLEAGELFFQELPVLAFHDGCPGCQSVFPLPTVIR